MWSIVIALALGIVMGHYRLLPAGVFRFTGLLTTVGIVFLLFLMGGQIGSDEVLLSGLAEMGLQAVVYALAGIFSSVLGVKVLEAFLSLKQPGPWERGSGG